MVTEQKDAGGSFKISDVVDFGFKRVGPGVFFALFGAWILYTSVSTQISVKPTQLAQVGNKNIQETIGNIKRLIKELPIEKQKSISDAVTILQIQLAGTSPASFIGAADKPAKKDSLPSNLGEVKG